MCLLDSVAEYDDRRIVRGAVSQSDPSNPLRGADGLAAIHALEYAAQGMALHGALTGELACGFVLAAVHDVEMRVPWLHDIVETMEIEAAVVTQHKEVAMYRFAVSAGGSVLVAGRLTVALTGGFQQ